MPDRVEVRWDRLTGPEVAALARRTNVALVPVGCIETHGPHLPTGTDALHGLAVCEAAARLEPAVVLPPIVYNVNDEMQEYPGVIHIPQDTMTRLYHALGLECARNGFDHVLFMVSHGGSETPLDRLAADLLEARNRTGRWPFFALRVGLGELMGAERERCFPGVRDGHGGPVETSWILAAAPELVHLERVAAPGPVGERSLPYGRPRVPWNRLVPAGYTGDPRPADAAKGRRMLEAASRALADLVRAFRSFDPRKDA